MVKKRYFKTDAKHAPLCFSVQRRVRFEEVDPLGIVWHGRYPSYFEDARVAHGDHFGIGYRDFYAQGLSVPVRQMHVEYLLPLRYGETCRIEALLHWSRAARLNYEFCIYTAEHALATRGYTIQLMLDARQELLLIPPDFYRNFLARWSSGVCES